MAFLLTLPDLSRTQPFACAAAILTLWSASPADQGPVRAPARCVDISSLSPRRLFFDASALVLARGAISPHQSLDAPPIPASCTIAPWRPRCTGPLAPSS